VEHKDHPEHKDHHKEVPLLLQWHLQFFFANNDACLVEHKEHLKEVSLLLQWHLQLLIVNNEACLFRTCSFSSDQVPHLCFPLRITTTITILTPSGGNSRHL
jgi:hypothetical protein